MIYRDIYAGPPRWYGNQRTKKRYIAIHATANTASAEAEASYATFRSDTVSSHYYVDDDSIVQSLDTDLRAFHAGSRIGNDQAIAYELTSRGNPSRAWWVSNANIEWPLLAGAIARDCQHFGITPRDLTVAQIRSGDLTGIITHDEMRQAWGGTDHTDPGSNFPMDYLIQRVRAVEGDMAMIKEDVDTLWNTDGVLKAPSSALRERPENTHWAPASFLRSIRDAVRPKVVDGWEKLWPGEGPNTSVGVAARRAAISGRLVRQDTAELLAGQAAILAAITGQDVTTAVRAELDRAAQRERTERAAERAEMVAGLAGELAPIVAAELADQVNDLPADVVEAAIGRALARTRLAVDMA